ncbi:MAG: UDP-N-acetylmuramoyl-L-alanine--D-glutamate ligase [Gammaproteobacteria bacterium]|nr:UDP-N-acetylmuramoyl-L-alanine--D-glutamate ligase [Gammaproteobacteria bacterium]
MAATANDMTNELNNGLAKVHYLVVGLGKTGLACARFLAARGHKVSVVDSRAEPPGLADLRREWPELEVVTGGLDSPLLAQADVLVVSPGLSVKEPAIAAARQRGAEVVGDIELFARLAQAPVVAITGSNGKSTVTMLVGEMAKRAGLRVAVGGNIGTPVLELLDDDYELYVLELSSFQLETTASLKPVSAVVLNLSADHMDRYDGETEYAEAKRRIYQGCGVMVINRDDPAVVAMAESGRRQIGFTLEVPGEGEYGIRQDAGAAWLSRGEEKLLACDELKLPGRHNLANALSALALGEAAGLPQPAMLATLREFAGLPHRTQWVAEIDGVNYYNDSKGTNVGATVAAIEGLAGQLVLIAGGEGKGADFRPLRTAVADKVRQAVLIGRDASLIAEAIAGGTEVSFARDMQRAVEQAAAVARVGDSVLLSPACASFDMFRNYEERGEVFMAAVRGLADGA